MELNSKLLIKKIGENAQAVEVGISITDVSKTGVGFVCSSPLMIGEVYESFLTIWTKEVLHAFLEIVRIVKRDDGTFEYGAIFIGMPEMDASRIEVYATVNEMNS